MTVLTASMRTGARAGRCREDSNPKRSVLSPAAPPGSSGPDPPGPCLSEREPPPRPVGPAGASSLPEAPPDSGRPPAPDTLLACPASRPPGRVDPEFPRVSALRPSASVSSPWKANLGLSLPPEPGHSPSSPSAVGVVRSLGLRLGGASGLPDGPRACSPHTHP